MRTIRHDTFNIYTFQMRILHRFARGCVGTAIGKPGGVAQCLKAMTTGWALHRREGKARGSALHRHGARRCNHKRALVLAICEAGLWRCPFIGWEDVSLVKSGPTHGPKIAVEKFQLCTPFCPGPGTIIRTLPHTGASEQASGPQKAKRVQSHFSHFAKTPQNPEMDGPTPGSAGRGHQKKNNT